MIHGKIAKLLVLVACLLPVPLLAQTTSELLDGLRTDWATANYQLTGGEQEKAYQDLIDGADLAVTNNPGSAEMLVWNGIIKAAYAGVKGGLSALSYAKQARKSLEASLQIDDRALNGSAYASLGTLYSNVPGWPLGFGDDKKAVKMLEKALELNPGGIDSNYFYADHLMREKDFVGAEKYLLKAQQAAPRVDQPVADAGRQQAILVALAKVRENLGRRGS